MNQRWIVYTSPPPTILIRPNLEYSGRGRRKTTVSAHHTKLTSILELQEMFRLGAPRHLNMSYSAEVNPCLPVIRHTVSEWVLHPWSEWLELYARANVRWPPCTASTGDVASWAELCLGAVLNLTGHPLSASFFIFRTPVSLPLSLNNFLYRLSLSPLSVLLALQWTQLRRRRSYESVSVIERQQKIYSRKLLFCFLFRWWKNFSLLMHSLK